MHVFFAGFPSPHVLQGWPNIRAMYFRVSTTIVEPSSATAKAVSMMELTTMASGIVTDAGVFVSVWSATFLRKVFL